mgnify:CR=1 FL=1
MHVLPYLQLRRLKPKQYSNDPRINAIRELEIKNVYDTLTDITDQFYKEVNEILLLIANKTTDNTLLNEITQYARNIVHLVKIKIKINVPNNDSNKKAIENIITNITEILSIIGQVILDIKYEDYEEYKKLIIVLDNLIRLSAEVYRFCMTLAVKEGICISMGLLSIC